MTTPPRGSPRVSGSSPRISGGYGAIPEKGTEGYARALGRAFVIAVAATLRNLRSYPADNPVVQKSAGDIATTVQEFIAEDGAFDFRLAGEFLFLNATRLRLDLETWATFEFVRATLRLNGTGQLRVERGTDAAKWTRVAQLLLATEGQAPAEAHAWLRTRFGEEGLDEFEIGPPLGSDDVSADADGEDEGRDSAEAYAQAVAALRESLRALSIGDGLNVKRMKRIVQLIVDRVIADEVRMLGLTTVREYAPYEVTHAVHCCVFSVALGRRLGLSRMQLYDLGLAALFHDFGMARVPVVDDKPGPLSDEEFAAIQAHTWIGVIALFQLREHLEFPYRSMLVSYEHHMRGARGYPPSTRVAGQTFFTRIVCVADCYDAAVTKRVYRPTIQGPAEVMAELRSNAARGLDPVLLKAFSGMLGRYPVGTVVLLDTTELAIVHAASGAPEHRSRPVVRIIATAAGERPFPGELVDVSDRLEDGRFRRTILATVDPDRYGIKVGDYFVAGAQGKAPA